MTEGEKAYYRRRIREELAKADAPENRQIRSLHLRWALLYQERLDGAPKHVTRALETRLRETGIDFAHLADINEHPAEGQRAGHSLASKFSRRD